MRSKAVGRDVSPDSVVYTLDSNVSVFSSASASVGRCSFASDSHASDDSFLLQGGETESSGGSGNVSGNNKGSPTGEQPRQQTAKYQLQLPAESFEVFIPRSDGTVKSDRPCPLSTISNTVTSPAAVDEKDKLIVSVLTSPIPRTTASYSRVVSSRMEEEDTCQHSYSSRTSFSLAIKECQDRRTRDDDAIILNTGEARRPVSLDLGNVLGDGSLYSTGGSFVSNCSASRRSSGNFLSPGTPTYVHRVSVTNKGWSSERVPAPSASAGSNSKVQHVRGSLYYSATCSNVTGKTLPSKWEDAERWIFSPGSHPKVPSQPGVRKPKSKSGPLGTPGFVCQHSLRLPVDAPPVGGKGDENAKTGIIDCSSPVSSGIAGNCGYIDHLTVCNEPCIARSVSIHGFPEGMARHSIHTFGDAKISDFKDAVTGVSRSVSRRDISTQMSPSGSFHSSPTGRFSFSTIIPSVQPAVDLQWHPLDTTKINVRDVQVDERLMATKWPKRPICRNRKKSLDSSDDWKSANDSRSSGWDISEAAKIASKCKREEAKIDAWESLQKAKAEAAIRKLEMKLEKKRSSSIEKIMNKLRYAQKRAQEMRSTVVFYQKSRASETSSKAVSFRRTRPIGSLTGCFACHAF